MSNNETNLNGIEIPTPDGNKLIVYSTTDLRTDLNRPRSTQKRHVPLYTRYF